MTRRKRTPTVQMKFSDETQSSPPLLLNSPVTSEQHSGRSLLPDHRSGNHSVAGSGTNRGSTAPTNPLFIAEEISTVDGQKITVLKPFTAAQPNTPTDRYSDSSSRHSQGMSPITPQFVPQPPFSVPLRTTSVKLNAPQEPLMLTRGRTDYQSPPSMTLSMAPGMIFTATDDYHPRMSDEILVKRGDVLVVLEVFNDGWTRVANRTTSATGFAPSVLLG
ncbi:hypothetical protein M427DRAFT_316924 [Gonapodya prolifera JEL478]|uniref:SH3 domain-containing protein n=1 Tax=Gonapodya prolifera (strain JEL478) TaxID=1344416 RepID=A0A139AX76_GONPJ|nr:hypothetical protein M427DRAFT_316924 [Gonapodya prolifera JEL478]|eukprot:KXS21328.1 hypothetical protein M427DRAFT_316924 [Gonapodya prolifera JEL478]